VGGKGPLSVSIHTDSLRPPALTLKETPKVSIKLGEGV
jgi:hypothetical protein